MTVAILNPSHSTRAKLTGECEKWYKEAACISLILRG